MRIHIHLHKQNTTMINKYMIGIKTKTTIYAPEDALKTMKKREAS